MLLLLGAFVAAAPAMGQVDADLAAARAASGRRDWAAALPLFVRLVERDGSNADLLIEAARVHGWADRNAEAAQLYRRALIAAPARRADIVPSLAWQALWAGRPAEAAALFEESMTFVANRSAADAVQALDGLAQAWEALGDTEGAALALRKALALQPGHARLALRLATALNEAGRHRAAIEVLLPAGKGVGAGVGGRFSGGAGGGAGGGASDGDTRLALARTLWWAGYADRAAPLLAGQPGAEATGLRDRQLARELSPHAELTSEHSTDRDGLRVDAWRLGGTRGVGGGGHAPTLDVQARRASIADPSGAVQAAQLEVAARWRHGEPTGSAGTLWPQVALRAHRSGDWQTWLPAARLKWIPDDGWRVDGDAAREIVETPTALARRVSLATLALGADWRRDARWLFTGAGALQRFDDGTRRQRALVRGEWTFQQRPRLALGAQALQLERTADGAPGSDSRGYWNPRRYGEQRLYLASTHESRPFELQARLGVARVRETDSAGTPGRATPVSWEIAAGADLSAALRLQLTAGGSGGQGGLAAGSGYWRRGAGVSLQGWF